MEQKGRDVPDVRTPACMKAPEVPPLLVRASDQSHEKIAGRLSKFSGGLVRNRCRPLSHVHRTMGVQDPLCKATATETSGTGDHIPQGVPKVVVSEPSQCKSCGTRERSTQPLVPCSQGNRGVEADHRSVLPQCLRALPELHYGDASVNPQGPTTGPVVNLPRPERCLLSYRDRPSGQTLPTLLSQRHRLIYSTAIRVVNQSESIYQNTQTCTSICPSGKIAHVHRRLVAKPRDTPGSSRANILAQVPVPKARVGFKPREIGYNPISGCHLSGDRAGHSCRPGKAVTQEVDQLAIHSGGIHSTAVTTCCPVAPSTWTPSLSRETSALWSNLHSSHSMAIETPLESVEGEILETDSTRPSVPPGILWWTNRDNLRRGVPIGTIDVEYYLYTDSSTQGWGAHLQELTASGIWSQDQSQLHINVLELQAIWLGLRAFSQRVENAKVALMSDNTSAVAYLRNQGGTKSLAMSDLATDMGLWAE